MDTHPPKQAEGVGLMEAELCATVMASLSSGIYEPWGHLDLFKKPPVHVGTFSEVVAWRPEH